MARPRTLLPVALAVVVAGAMPAGAAASTVVKTANNAIEVSGGPGENNNVNVTVAGPEIVFVDTAGLTDAGGCIQQDPTTVRCAKADVTGVSLAVGDGANAVTTRAPYPTLVSGAGATKNDFNVLHAAGSLLQGSEGSDDLLSRAGSDILNGAGGDDRLVPGLGVDVVQGDAGQDSVSYSERSAAVNVTLDGVANDGEAGEADLVGVTVEQVFGGAGKDTLTGDAGPNVIYGGAGADRISGGAGDDDLRGDAGNDRITGQAGVDQMHGGPNDDRLGGGAGEDVLFGLGGADDLRGGPGADSITGGGGRDRLLGGAANDVLRGEGGGDTLRGDVGSDVLEGGRGTDSLKGGGGGDIIRGGSGRDRLLGQGGRDALFSSDDAADRVNCGGSRDRVSADRRDSVVACESRVARS